MATLTKQNGKIWPLQQTTLFHIKRLLVTKQSRGVKFNLEICVNKCLRIKKKGTGKRK